MSATAELPRTLPENHDFVAVPELKARQTAEPPTILNGFTPEQWAETVYVIARKACSLRDLLESIIDNSRGSNPEMNAAHSMAQLIGAMADHLNATSSFEGNVLSWTIGEEVEHGGQR